MPRRGSNLAQRLYDFKLTFAPDLLGLKLETTKGPVEMFVIDHVEKPAAN